MNTNHIPYLLAVLDTGSINKAAQKLNIPPYRLGTILTNIENEFGAILFHRTRQGISFTQDGAYFIERMQCMDAILKEVKSNFSQTTAIHKEIAGNINFYTTPSISNNYFSLAINHFLDDYPNIEVIYYEDNDVASILSKVNEHPNSIGVVPSISESQLDILAPFPQLSISPFFRQVPVAVISDKSKRFNVQQKNVSLRTLSRLPLVVISATNHYESYISESFFKHFNYQPAKKIVTGCLQSYFNYISRGDCFGIIGKDDVENKLFHLEYPHLKILFIRERFYINYNLAYMASKHLATVAKLFITYLFDHRDNYAQWTSNNHHLEFVGLEKPAL